MHGLKFQFIVIPNGLLANLFEPNEGRRHDSSLFCQLEGHMNDVDVTVFSLYDDPAYPLRTHLLAPFKRAVLTDEEKTFNKKSANILDEIHLHSKII